jgi:NAD(P)-dependent dehydrogenase (short-subunit alcohol dehydrogenase family)
MEKVALVTGVSSGIGRATAQGLVAAGFRVFGTVRGTIDPIERVELVRMDVRDDASVAAGVAEVIARAGRIDVVINNAGGTILGAVEETGVDQAQALFDVNFFGAVRVTNAALPHMRAQKSGRIIFVSSLVGFLPAPFMGFYAATKHAVEGLAESLDHEVRTLGIRTLLVEPAFIRTDIDKNSAEAKKKIGDYAEMRERTASGINASVQKGDDPETVARVLVKASTVENPKLRWRAGKGAGLLAVLRALLPAGMFDRSLRKEFKLDAPSTR